MADIKAGITLFSLGTAYLKGELDLEGVIRTAAEMGAEGYEIVASQMIPSYPYVSDEFVEFVNEMEKKYDRIHNFNVSVKEIDNRVIFLRKLVPGGSEHSFGIHVAQMAGMPPSIVKRASRILKDLEASGHGHDVEKALPKEGEEDAVQLNFFQLDDPVLCQIRDRILDADINSLTPLEALNILNEIKKLVKGE